MTDFAAESQPFITRLLKDDLPTLGKAAESFEREFSHPERVEIFNALLEHLDKPDTEDKQALTISAFLLLSNKFVGIPPANLSPYLLSIAEDCQFMSVVKFLHSVVTVTDELQKVSRMSAAQLVDYIGSIRYSNKLVEALKIRLFDVIYTHPTEIPPPTFMPTFLSACPAMLDELEDEYQLTPVPFPLDDKTLWLPGYRESSSEEKERILSSLLQQACARPLLLDERKSLSQILRLATDRSTFSDALVGSLQASSMLVHNSSLVQEVVIALSALRSPLAAQFLAAFLSTPATTDHIEAVRSIMNQKCNLPATFLPQFVSHCMESSYSTLDPTAQMRLVRWTCIFIQTVLKDEPGSLLSLFGAIQSFCLSFTSVREAVALYTMLKSLEGH